MPLRVWPWSMEAGLLLSRLKPRKDIGNERQSTPGEMRWGGGGVGRRGPKLSQYPPMPTAGRSCPPVCMGLPASGGPGQALTEHGESPPVGVAPLHPKRVHQPVVPLHGDAGHGQGLSDDGSALDEGHHLADEGTCSGKRATGKGGELSLSLCNCRSSFIVSPAQKCYVITWQMQKNGDSWPWLIASPAARVLGS